ncbi:peptidylprolyl isomerase [Thiohalobacter thiocyanaticus]|nr:peptidylprolyl isomerase [Thiohalobacter thiocyanaticus]
MMKNRLASLLLAASLPLTPALAADEDVVARVNGEPVSQAMLDFYRAQKQRQLGGREPDPDNLLKEVIDIELMIQDAHRQGLDQHPELQQQLEFYRQNLMVNMAARQYLQRHPVTEDDIQAAYEELAASQTGNEYHARHILVDSEAQARELISRLDDGADFAELAKAESTGPTGPRGGDLGWFSPDRMVKEFSEAVQQMDKGEHSSAPVKTQFGWHVIKLEDTRKAQAPALEEVREQIVNRLNNQRLSEYMAELRKDAKIETTE